MMLFLAILIAIIFAPDAASAEPITGALTVFFGNLALSAGIGLSGAFAVGAFASKLITSAALSLVGQLLSKKQSNVKSQGIQTDTTTAGDTTPQKFVVGRYAVEGHAVAPSYAREEDNRILTYILEVSNIPIKGLTDRIIIDGQYTALTTAADDPSRLDFSDLGTDDAGNAFGWLWFMDGTQTTAHFKLVESYGNDPDRPWTPDHVLRGTAYAVLEFALDREIYSGLPSVRFEVEGVALYDPRKDSTVGGSGPQRWDDPATWAFSDNPQVINYNVLRGITLPTGDIYGGQVPAEDLPLDNWFAGMNECDVMIGDRKQYVAGFEINTGQMEPFEVIEEMNRASFAQISEFGGVFRIRVGAPATPVMTLTDDDFIITEASSFDPFPGLASTYNAITGTYVEPVDVWEGRSADAITNAEWEAEDGGRRLTVDIGLPAVSSKSQTQQLLTAYIKDHRRFRAHRMLLPFGYAMVEPLDTLAWSSEINGYTNKVFEVTSVEVRTDTLNQFVTVREREAGDVAWTPAQDVPAPPPTNTLTPPAATVPSLTVSAFSVKDGDDVARRPGIALTWPPEEAPSAETLKYEIRVAVTGDAVMTDVVSAREGSSTTMDGIIANVEYEARAKYITGMPSAWTDWLSVTASNILLGEIDLVGSLTEKINTAFERHDQALNTLTSGNVFQLFNEVRIEDGILAAQDVTNSARLLIETERSEDAFARITEERDIRVTEDEALASQILTVITNVNNNAAAIVIEQTARANADTSMANNIASLSAVVNINTAGLVTEQTVRADADSAITSNVTALTVTVGENAAAIIDEQVARADADSALTSSQEVLRAQTTARNLIPNGGLESGTLDEWIGVPAQFDIVERDDNSAASDGTAPTPNILLMPQSGTIYSATVLEDFPVAPGLGFVPSFDVAGRSVSSVGTVKLQSRFKNGSGAVVQDWADILTWDSSGTADWESVSGAAFLTPSGGLKMSLRLIREAGGFGQIYLANLMLIRDDQTSSAAQIRNLAATKTDVDGAVAAVEQEISAQYGDLAAMASATAFAEATADHIAAGYVWRLNGEDLLELVSVADGVDTGPTSTFLIDADYVKITGTAQIEDAIITGAKIGSAEVDSLQIAGNAATFGTLAESVTTLVGDGTLDLVFIESLSIPAGETADIYISISLEHEYAAGARDWGFEITRGFAPASPPSRILRSRLGMTAINDYPTITYMETITNGSGSASDYQVIFQWKGEDSGIEMTRANMSLLGRIR